MHWLYLRIFFCMQDCFAKLHQAFDYIALFCCCWQLMFWFMPGANSPSLCSTVGKAFTLPLTAKASSFFPSSSVGHNSCDCCLLHSQMQECSIRGRYAVFLTCKACFTHLCWHYATVRARLCLLKMLWSQFGHCLTSLSKLQSQPMFCVFIALWICSVQLLSCMFIALCIYCPALILHC